MYHWCVVRYYCVFFSSYRQKTDIKQQIFFAQKDFRVYPRLVVMIDA